MTRAATKRPGVYSFAPCFLFFSLLMFILTPSVHGDSKETDTDGDGWPDQYEMKLGSDPKSADSIPVGFDDKDKDGLKNIEEMIAGTDPADPDSDNDKLSDAQEVQWKLTDPLSPDTDYDGLNDFSEILLGTDPSLPDTDGDGWLDGAEQSAGSDPFSQVSTPKTP